MFFVANGCKNDQRIKRILKSVGRFLIRWTIAFKILSSSLNYDILLSLLQPSIKLQ